GLPICEVVAERQEKAAKKAAREKRDARREALTPYLPDDAEPLVAEGTGGVYLVSGQTVFAQGGVIQRTLYPGEIALCEEVYREKEGREVLVSRTVEVVREDGTRRGPLVTDPRDPSYAGTDLYGDAVFCPRPGDMDRVVLAARALGKVRGLYRRIVIPHQYGMHDTGAGAMFYAGTRVLAADGWADTPEDAHPTVAAQYTPADPDPAQAGPLLDLLLRAYDEHGAHYVAPLAGATYAAAVLP